MFDFSVKTLISTYMYKNTKTFCQGSSLNLKCSVLEPAQENLSSGFRSVPTKIGPLKMVRSLKFCI